MKNESMMEICTSIKNGNRQANYVALLKSSKKDLINFLTFVSKNQHLVALTVTEVLLGLKFWEGRQSWS